MLHAALDRCDAPTSVALVPGAIELFGYCAQLHDQIAGEVLGLGFTAFFAPEAQQSLLIAAHDDAGVRAANDGAPVLVGPCPQTRGHGLPPGSQTRYCMISKSRYDIKHITRYQICQPLQRPKNPTNL